MEQGVGVAEVKTSSGGFAVEKRKTYLTLSQKEMGRKMSRQGRLLIEFTSERVWILSEKKEVNSCYKE